LKNKRWILWLVVLAALVALVLYGRHRVHFDWHTFTAQLRQADWKKFAIGIAMIYLGYGFRAWRWALFLKPVKRVGPAHLLGPQVIGFTGVALFGRLADLMRPYLIARKVQLSVGSQVAVYTVERMFDMGSMALIFSLTLLLAPDRASLPHHELLYRGAAVGLILSVAMGIFAALVRASGHVVARSLNRAIHPLSPRIGAAVASKIEAFRDGLNTLSTLGDFALALGMSLAMWGMITFAYLETTRAFVASPELSRMDLPRCMILMAASMGGSIVQLPVIGWFTTIGATSFTMHALLNVAPEPALGCATMLLVVTFMSIIPVGLIWARFEHVSLKKVASESEHAKQEEPVSSTPTAST
jgi:uncharacterized membrane protein YbhN (UPF0104 family)